MLCEPGHNIKPYIPWFICLGESEDGKELCFVNLAFISINLAKKFVLENMCINIQRVKTQ